MYEYLWPTTKFGESLFAKLKFSYTMQQPEIQAKRVKTLTVGIMGREFSTVSMFRSSY